MAWTDATKQDAIDAYVESEPTPANSMEIVKEIAEKFGESPNGLRLILSKAQVYVKKEAAASKDSGDTSEKPKRVSKADSLAELKAALKAAGQPVDDEIIDKLTAKAAVYFAAIVSSTGN